METLRGNYEGCHEEEAKDRSSSDRSCLDLQSRRRIASSTERFEKELLLKLHEGFFVRNPGLRAVGVLDTQEEES